MTVTKFELVKNVIGLGVNGKVAKKTVQTFIDCIVGSIKSGEKVQISGFGTFIIREKKERVGAIPKQGRRSLSRPRGSRLSGQARCSRNASRKG